MNFGSKLVQFVCEGVGRARMLALLRGPALLVTALNLYVKVLIRKTISSGNND